MTADKKIFVDTSAYYALMDRSDKHHKEAASLWSYLLEQEIPLLTDNYIVVETMALIQNRLGFDAANLCYSDILGITEIRWIDESLHEQAFELWSNMGLRRLSLVDCVSFITMRHHQLGKVFGFDEHFAEQGFEILTLK